MNRTQALRKAIEIFGKTAGVRDSGRPSSHEQRAIARAEQKVINERCNMPELRKAHRKELDEILFRAIAYRYSIGRVEMGMFFAVKACGDSWEGCFRALEQQPSAGTAHEQPDAIAA